MIGLLPTDLATGTHCAFAVWQGWRPPSVHGAICRTSSASGIGCTPELATIENGLVFLEEALAGRIHLAELIAFSGRPDDDQVDTTAEKVGPIRRLQFILNSFRPFLHQGGSPMAASRREVLLGAFEGLPILSEKWKVPVITGFKFSLPDAIS